MWLLVHLRMPTFDEDRQGNRYCHYCESISNKGSFSELWVASSGEQVIFLKVTSTLISTTLRPSSTLMPRWPFHRERSGNSGCGICWSDWTPIILWVSPGVHACHSHWLFLQVIVCGDVLMKMTNWCVWLLWAGLRAETLCVWPSEEARPDFSPDRVCISPCHLLIASSEADGGTGWGK